MVTKDLSVGLYKETDRSFAMCEVSSLLIEPVCAAMTDIGVVITDIMQSSTNRKRLVYTDDQAFLFWLKRADFKFCSRLFNNSKLNLIEIVTQSVCRKESVLLAA